MLIAEEFVLLALDPDGRNARGASNQPAAAVGVTGALVAELVLDGHLDVADGRIHPTGTRPEHPMLAQALENVARHEGKKLKSRFDDIEHSGWSEVVDGMVESGVLGREHHALQATRHPVTDPAAHAALLARVRGAATGSGPMDPRTATLLALSGPCYLLEVVAPERSDRRHAKARIAEAAEQVPVAESVKRVIEAAAATVAAVAATGAVVASSG